jgi:hypothetical protein
VRALGQYGEAIIQGFFVAGIPPGAVLQIPMRPQNAFRNKGDMQVARCGFCYLAQVSRSLIFDSALTTPPVIEG